jgi:hypothetical protein
MEQSELEEIERRLHSAERSIPPPWEPFMETPAGIGGGSFLRFGSDTDRDDEIDVTIRFGHDEVRSPDSRLDDFLDFIANAIVDIPRLIGEVRRLQEDPDTP